MALEYAQEVYKSWERVRGSFWDRELHLDDRRASFEGQLLLDLIEEVHLLRLDLFKLYEHHTKLDKAVK